MLVLMGRTSASRVAMHARLQVDSHDGTRVSGFLPSTQSFFRRRCTRRVYLLHSERMRSVCAEELL